MIAGLPAIDTRDLIRTIRGYDFSVANVMCVLGMSSFKAKKQLEMLAADGFIKSVSQKRKQLWAVTEKGHSLALASAAKRVKRATADRHYAAFMQRVIEINESEKYLFRVPKVVLFGSYLGIKETVSDIDVAVWMERKETCNETFFALQQRMTIEQEMEGRIFRTFSESIDWPESDVLRYLKNRSRVISLHNQHEGVLKRTKSKVVYEYTE